MCRYTFRWQRACRGLVIGGQGVGVDLRTSSRRNRDGSTVRYVSIAHNERSPGGPSGAKVLLPLGREDRLDVAGLRRLVGSINRYLGEDAGSDADAQVGAEAGGGLTITYSRPARGVAARRALAATRDRNRAARGARPPPVRHGHRASGLRAGCLPGDGPA